MSTDFDKLRQVFQVAVEQHAASQWDAYLDQACAGDPELRHNVARLLKAHAEGGSVLGQPAHDMDRTGLHQPFVELPGAIIGPYKLLQQIGEGGMGIVYMAEQQQPVRRKVALKIIKPGMDSKQVIARFEAERQALALMDHQNIAKVFDAGTTENGRPYFVMELVHGVPITQYCDDQHLTPKARLELFLPVCHAVQHAHQKGIIHRDLKPSNLLVCLYDGVPVPKVIDFGIAKATGPQLTERTMFTQFGTLVGTLEYMSPEQAEMSQLGIDTRSDVYSLGVLLYELLTGTTPLERHRLREAGFDEIRRLIREEEPPKPSTRLSTSGVALAAISAQRQTEPAKLTRLLRGELDWIVMRCLEKDRSRRYETANGLARDVESYLHDEPVEACPPTAGYKLRKFAHKNQKLLATVTAFAALLLLGVVASAWQAVRATQAEAAANANAVQAQEKEQEANQQRDEAQRQRDEARALAEKLQAALEQLRRTTYAAHMSLAQHAWAAGGIKRVLELLEQHRPKAGESDLRGFEWHYLYRLCHSDLLTLHTGRVDSVAYSPDGKRLASAGWIDKDPVVKVWDAQTGQELLSLQGGGGGPPGSKVAFSPDGKRLAGASRDHTVKVWDAQTGQELLSLKVGEYDVRNVAYSPDGKRLAAGSGTWDDTKNAWVGGEVKIWDAQTGQELLSLKQNGALWVSFSPDGKRLASASGSDDIMGKVWDAQTGQDLLSLKGGAGPVAFSPDGKRLASGTKVWDAQTGQVLLNLKAAGWSVVFSPDGKRLTGTSRYNTVKVWDAQTGQELLNFKGHTSQVNSVVFSPDGTRLASGSGDGTVKVWDATTSREARTLQGHTGMVVSVAYSPDGKRLASGAWENTVKVWDAQTSQELLTLKGHTGSVFSVAYSSDGKHLASGSRDKTVKVWDAQTGRELLVVKGHTDMVFSVAFSPDGKRLASASFDKTVKIWDAQTGQEVLSLKLPTEWIYSVTFSPDGKRLASATDEEIKVWDAQTGQELVTLKAGADGVAFSPDGKRLASGSRGNSVKIWDAQTGQELLSFKGHSDILMSVAFSPDGKRLASTSHDGTLKVWDAQTGQELLTFKGYERCVTFSPDGHRLASTSDDLDNGKVTIWDATLLPEKR